LNSFDVGFAFISRHQPLGDCQHGGVGELVARPNYEFGKGELGIQFGIG
jgi:hypothetical protein